VKKFFSLSLILVLVLGLSFTVGAQELERKVVSDSLIGEIGEYGGEYVISLTSAPQTFNYYGAIDWSTFSIMTNVLDSLVEANPVTKEIEPGLAKSWEYSDDGTTVTLNLRKGVKWSDDEPFTADDVIFTFNNLTLNPNAEANEVSRYEIEGEMVEFTKVDDYTVEVNLPAPYGPFMKILSQAPIAPEHKLAKHLDPENPGAINEAWSTGTELSEIVGTGPFTVDQYSVDQKLVLKRNPNSWRYDSEGNQLPYVDQLVYVFVQNSEVQLAQFQAGEIDQLTISGKDFPMLKQQEVDGADFKVLTGKPVNPTPSPTHLSFNFDIADKELREAFRTLEFREAMAHLIDRQRIIDDVYNTLAIESGMPVVPTNKAFYNPEIEELRRDFNLEKARTILDDLGYEDTDGDGIRELADGEDFEFTLTTAVDSQDRVDIASLLKDNLEEVGIKVNLNLIKGSLVFDKALAGEFESMVMAFGNQPDPQFRKAIWQPGRALYYWHLSTMGENDQPIMENMFDWEKEIFEMFEKGQVTMEHSARREYYDRWQLINAQKLPVIFITKGMDLSAVQDNVGNYYVNDNGIIVGVNYTVYKK